MSVPIPGQDGIWQLVHQALNTLDTEMFSPASSGNVHIFAGASRAELACRLAMPGNPAFNARAGLGHGPLGCPLARGLGWRARILRTAHLHYLPAGPHCTVRQAWRARAAGSRLGRFATEHIVVDTAPADDGPYCSSLSCRELVEP